MSIEDVIARLDSVLESIESARSSLAAAADMLADAHAILEDTWSGTSSFDAQDVLTWLADAERDIRDQILALTGGDERIRAYQGYWSGGSAGTGPVAITDQAQGRRPSSPEAGTPVPAVVTPERIEQLCDELPPTVVPGTGKKTHGRWVGPDGTAHPLTSGKDQLEENAVRVFRDELKSRRIPWATSDVEIKLAAHMRSHGIRSTTLVLNNVPCGGAMGCDALMPVILPPGYTLTVYGPDGFRREYRGGGTSKWVP